MTTQPIIRVELPAAAPSAAAPVAGVALVTIHRPEVLNALDRSTMRSLAETLETLDADPACRAIVITGAGERAFAAGADIRAMVDMSREDHLADDPLAAWDRVAAIGTPTIAAVRGYCLGGGFELALACHMVVAADDAVLGLPEVGLGIMPGAGGTQRLTRIVGPARATELILTGRRMDAREADRLGLVSRLVPAADLLDAALALAAAVAAMPTQAVRAALGAIAAASRLPLDQGVALERRLFADLFDTPDQAEGMRAFLERREPRWSDR
ncbi:MAG: enoyl-CoA hydratase/isomerase family protein [Chloroflexi bacterium]|nr:enoyl-CoA hydratase/isomerase family protein [Chloroflexota bacterium]